MSRLRCIACLVAGYEQFGFPEQFGFSRTVRLFAGSRADSFGVFRTVQLFPNEGGAFRSPAPARSDPTRRPPGGWTPIDARSPETLCAAAESLPGPGALRRLFGFSRRAPFPPFDARDNFSSIVRSGVHSAIHQTATLFSVRRIFAIQHQLGCFLEKKGGSEVAPKWPRSAHKVDAKRRRIGLSLRLTPESGSQLHSLDLDLSAELVRDAARRASRFVDWPLGASPGSGRWP
jgi:hypothetical protein